MEKQVIRPKYRVHARLTSSYFGGTPYLVYYIQKRFLNIWFRVSEPSKCKANVDEMCNTLNEVNNDI